jgi:hypothetical protein
MTSGKRQLPLFIHQSPMQQTKTKTFKPARAYTLAKSLNQETLEQLLYHIRSDTGALILELELALIDKQEAA